jgi:hypothetical protein
MVKKLKIALENLFTEKRYIRLCLEIGYKIEKKNGFGRIQNLSLTCKKNPLEN